MTPKLPSELQVVMHAHPGQPLEVFDDAGTAYMLVPKATFVHLSNMTHEVENSTRDALRQLIQSGIESGAGVPAETVFAELRQVATALDARSK